MTLLDVVIFLPLLAFLIILALPKDNQNAIRMFSLIASLAIFAGFARLDRSVLVRQPRASSPSKPISRGSSRRPSTITSASTASACGW